MLFANSSITLSEKYFKNALKFDPMRWDAEHTIHPYANLPFGIGIRMCLGRRIAEQEIYLTIIKAKHVSYFFI